MIGFLCGVPQGSCKAGFAQLNSGLKNVVVKAHPSPQEAFKCHVRYLVEQLGYKRVGSREFEPADGGSIRVLTKPSRFGGILRMGKNEKRIGKRFVPKHSSGGIVISE